MKKGLLLLSFLALLACSASDRATNDTVAATNEPTAATNVEKRTVDPDAATATTPRGHVITLEVVSNNESRARGLMFRESLPAERGMLFIFPKDDVHSFWMKNTLIPLDMIWLDSQRRIVHIAENVPPCPDDPCPNYSPDSKKTRYVLELGGGRARQLELRAGDELTFRNIDRYRVD